MSVQLVMSNSSVRDTTLSCDSLDIRYEVSHSRSGSITTVQKWDRSINKHTTVGEFRLPFFFRDTIRVQNETEWHPLKGFLFKEGRRIFNTSRVFEGAGGIKYKWRIQRSALQLCRASDTAGDQGGPLVVYHRPRQKEDAPFLEIIDPSVLYSLDLVVVTFLIMERKRRIRNRQRRGALIAVAAS
ncbi:hypothetical protein FRC20_006901 [Serendipita sp. 405]|nr:hypothetical protein FRC15_008503 [Serendipita sp. 397]KAG8867028.1 hypothetical protein FRC20_006901 [Serendipita sp. 405]